MKTLLVCATVGLFTTVPARASNGVDLASWLRWRGATVVPKLDIPPGNCGEIKVGPHGERGLRCDQLVHEARGKDETHVYRVTVLETVFVVRVGRTSKVFERLVAVSPLDTFDESPHSIVAVRAKFAPDGLSAEVVDDDPSRSCGHADAELARQAAANRDPSARRWIAIDRDLVARTCRGVGRYAWKEGRFVRK